MDRQAEPFAPRRERGLDSFKRSMRRNMRRGKGKSVLGAVLRGVLVAASITVLGVAAFALILNWWDASDRAITAINQVVKFVSILAGVTSAMSAGQNGGALRGACVGLLYMALGIVCYALMMGRSPQLTAYLADLGMGVAAGGLFGMILSARKSA
ncbi:MAG: TIGR04086 family membrane protein [Clostridia bacterium]|nr:TIGR04086 family membrane protein [Clostridia bacterium]